MYETLIKSSVRCELHAIIQLVRDSF